MEELCKDHLKLLKCLPVQHELEWFILCT